MGDVAKGIKSFKAGMKEGENEEIETIADEEVSDNKTKGKKSHGRKERKR